jgi:trimethylamine--corrinoid protein Co-methyltransferase
MRILNESDIERIHAQALKVLSDVGVRVNNGEICSFLEKKGIPVDGQTVRFPPEAVDWALKVAPRDVTLFGRNDDVLPLKPGHCYLSTYSDASNVCDYGAAGLRSSTRQDLINFVRLGQAMLEISIVGPVCYARDVPQPVQLLRSAEQVVLHSSKHINVGPLNLEEARIWGELAQLAEPGTSISDKPTVSMVVSPVSPLQLDYDTSTVLAYAAKRRVPLVIASCPMAGGTSPLALVGTIVLHLAEDLFVLTIAQFLNEGTPSVLGGAAGVLDMRTGMLSYGAPERHLLLGAIIELANYYGLPHHSPAGSVDSWYPDVHAGAEKMQCWMARKLSDIVWGISVGSLNSGSAVSLEQTVIDIDLWHEAERFFRGLNMAELESSFDAISRVGSGGNFLVDEQTLRLARSQELYYSDIVNRDGDRGPGMLERAHRKVEHILATHQYAPPDPIAEDIRRYVKDKEEELMKAAS